jgi:hypothetical protein
MRTLPPTPVRPPFLSHAHGALSAEPREPLPVSAGQPSRVSDEELAARLARMPLTLREQANQHMRALIDQGELVDSAAFTAALGISRQALSQALAGQRVFYVEMAGTRYFPSVFFDPRYERQQVEAVCKALGPLPGGTKMQFLQTPHLGLGGQSPLQALQKGRLAEVLRAAQAFLEI